MTSCSILISHFESPNFLRQCVRQIRRYTIPEIEHKLYIIDQSGPDTYNEIVKEYESCADISIVHTLPLYSGFGIDYVIREMGINTDYICQLHCDAFPISPKYLKLCISLIEEYNLSFIGQLQCINNSDNLASIYPPSPFFAMAQCFNVARTETYRELSLQAGFTRFHNRPQSGLSFANGDWDQWAAGDYANRGSDDDIVAFSWEDRHLQHDKIGLAITGFCQPAWGRIIDDIVFHFGSCRESIGTGGAMGDEYANYTRKINENYSDELIGELVSLAKLNKPPETEILSRNYWNGTDKTHSPTSDLLNQRIEELKIS